MAGKTRLDLLLVDKSLAPSRQRARALIMAGKVLVDNQPLDKPGTAVSETAAITLKGEDLPYVSRGGLKLAAALEAFAINVDGMVCLDVGASTGGFTDCLLQHGASRVYAVDVGYGQLAWSLRQDPRVVAIERTNIRHMPPGSLPEAVDLATIDTSFISLRIVVPETRKFLKPGGRIIALIKPQFEVGKGMVGKGGVVKDGRQHNAVIAALRRFFEEQGMRTGQVVASPILGPKGNKEFAMLIQAE
ncbi:TlyA family RNA methyltransferase [Desulfatitalea alkaliphila]|uniref:TlyA family RNA methyltransferase n=1 Tax=Desulfatitalea alkaliphila TaxID=2929485 RepID=A0AA41ULJ5_9BACT|nr:TlyA family RNA methyltransferase [Desulfatitalea alkaliphila]MCJ8502497.1 TlyA family RNA methyltransferase [Desulfatitalea alkaliphila]